jgi:hypothetical protein
MKRSVSLHCNDSARSYSKGGWLGHVHTAVMQLQPGQTYSYRVGDPAGGWSDVFTYNALPADIGSEARPLRLLQVADMAYDHNSDHTVRCPPLPPHSHALQRHAPFSAR